MRGRKARFVMVFAVVFFMSVVFAGGSVAPWQTTAVIGVTISTFLLSLIYMIGKGFNIHELQFLAKEDMFWVFAVAVLVAGFSSFTTLLNVLVNPSGGSVLAKASNVVSTLIQTTQTAGSELASVSDSIAKQGSKSVFCSFGGFGFNVAACGGFSYVGASFTFVYQMIGLALAELWGLSVFLSVSHSAVMSFFLPLGIFLIAFPMFRGAGSVLLAIALTFYVVIPYTIVIVNGTINSNAVTSVIASQFGAPSLHVPSARECDEYSFDSAGLGSFFSSPAQTSSGGGSGNEAEAIKQYAGFLNKSNGRMSTIDYFIWLIGFRVTLLVVSVLVVMLAAIQFLSQVFGTPISPYNLQRLV